MRLVFLLLIWLGIGHSLAAMAQVPDTARRADIVFLGEVHDNPGHHARQAAWVAALRPSALVFEMLPADVARRLGTAGSRDEADLARETDWARSGWPDFGLYFPIFRAARGARIFGAAVPRKAAKKVMADGFEAMWPLEDIHRFGLDASLSPDQQEQREAAQMSAHCDALPVSLLPGMVAVQRLRDAELARAALMALEDTGGPVVVITGNGHARKDWGAPALLETAAPDLTVFALGQSETGQSDPKDGGGAFDLVLEEPAPVRADPCEAFR